MQLFQQDRSAVWNAYQYRLHRSRAWRTYKASLVNGLYAPGQGLFPKYTDGTYSVNDTTLVVSRGVGNSGWTQRFQTPLNLCFSLLKNNSFSPIRIRKIPKAFESRLCSILFASHADIITAAVPTNCGNGFFPFHKLVFRVKHKAYYCDRDKNTRFIPCAASCEKPANTVR